MQSVEPHLLKREEERGQQIPRDPNVVMRLTLEDPSALVNQRLVVFKALGEVLRVPPKLCRHLYCCFRNERFVSLAERRVKSAASAAAYLSELLGQVIVQLARAAHVR